MYSFAIFCVILAAAHAGIIGQPTLAYSTAPGLPAGLAPGLAYPAPALAYPSAPTQFAPTAYSFSFLNRGSSVVPYGPYGAVAAPAVTYAAPPGVGINAGAYTLAAPAGVTYAAAAPEGVTYAATAPAGIALNAL